MTTKKTNTVNASANTPKFDIAKYAEEKGLEVEFFRATTYGKDETPVLLFRCDKFAGYGRVTYDAEMRYADILHKKVKIVVDPTKEIWDMVYPDRTVYPKKEVLKFEALPAEVLAYCKKVRG